MKMRLLCLTLIASCFFADTSFAQKAKMTPLQYNDKLASLTDSLYNMGIEWGVPLFSVSQAKTKTIPNLQNTG